MAGFDAPAIATVLSILWGKGGQVSLVSAFAAACSCSSRLEAATAVQSWTGRFRGSSFQLRPSPTASSFCRKVIVLPTAAFSFCKLLRLQLWRVLLRYPLEITAFASAGLNGAYILFFSFPLSPSPGPLASVDQRTHKDRMEVDGAINNRADIPGNVRPDTLREQRGRWGEEGWTGAATLDAHPFTEEDVLVLVLMAS